MELTQSFQGKWAIIVGGSGAIGSATAEKLASHGMNICLVYRERRQESEKIDAWLAKLKQSGVEVLAYNQDALSGEVIRDICQQLPGKVKLLLHALAKGTVKPLTGEGRSTAQDYAITQYAMAYNIVDWVNVILDENLFEENARVIGLDSEGNERYLPNYGIVGSTKSAMSKLIRDMSMELAPRKVLCTAIQSGVVDSKALQYIPEYERIANSAKARNPFNRLTLGEDVANVVFLLCLQEANWITGTTIQVDGGESNSGA